MSVLEVVRSCLGRLWGAWGIFWTTCVVLALTALAGQKVVKARKRAESLRARERTASAVAAIAVDEKIKEIYIAEATKASKEAATHEASAASYDARIQAAKLKAAALRASLGKGRT